VINVNDAYSHSTNAAFELYNQAHQRTGANHATRGFSFFSVANYKQLGNDNAPMTPHDDAGGWHDVTQ